jgi:hypothetical protein
MVIRTSYTLSANGLRNTRLLDLGLREGGGQVRSVLNGHWIRHRHTKQPLN